MTVLQVVPGETVRVGWSWMLVSNWSVSRRIKSLGTKYMLSRRRTGKRRNELGTGELSDLVAQWLSWLVS